MKLPDWLFGRPAAARIAPLSSRHAARLAEIHSEAFTRPWDAVEFERWAALNPPARLVTPPPVRLVSSVDSPVLRS